MNNALEINNLFFSYNEMSILEDISLTIAKGSYTAILGPNGGGKTTLLKIILSILKPQKGDIKVLGSNPYKKRIHIGYVPQNLDIKRDFPVTVFEMVLAGFTTGKSLGFIYTKNEKKKALEVLETVGSAHLKEKKMGELSGGERQRVYLARSLVSDPEMLLLDEPTSNIDPYGAFCFLKFLESLKGSKTILVVTHDLSIMATQITSLACLNKKLLYNEQPILNQEMLTLLYGYHDERTCAIGRYAVEEAAHLKEFREKTFDNHFPI
jgi:zinc transport system ATP-binding protein